MQDFPEAIQAGTETSNVLAVLGLDEPPFAEEVSDRFFFPSQQHLRALGFIGQLIWSRANLAVITGERGIGKSLLIRHLLSDLDDRVLAASVQGDQNAIATDAQQFLLSVLQQFGLQLEASDRGDRRRLLVRFLTHQYSLNRLCLLVVEGAQALRPAVLDELLQIAELTIDGQRVVKLLLLGSSTLTHIIESPRMANLTPGRAPRFSLDNLSEDQVAAYVVHRLRAAGAVDADALMPAELMSTIHRYTWGVPRAVNQLCERAMNYAVVKGEVRVTPAALTEAAVALLLIPSADEIDELQNMALPQVRPSPETKDNAADSAPQALLLLSAQGMADSVVPLTSTRILIGRGELADVRIDSAFVSRYHALIVRETQRDLLLDLGSTNGLLVNSQQVARRVLKHRDLIQIGPARMTYLNPAIAPPLERDPSETLAFARPGAATADDESAEGAIMAFGRFDQAG